MTIRHTSDDFLHQAKMEIPDGWQMNHEPNRSGVLQRLKNHLVGLGPYHWAPRAALKAEAFRQGWSLRFNGDKIAMLKGNRELILASREFIYVPMMFWYADFYFDTMVPRRVDGREVWDYSVPAEHTYRQSNLTFLLPALPEEDAMEVYTHWYTPQPGDTVWDVGAHAGVTTYFLSKFVGETGKVYAWEPDRFNYECLLKNIEQHKLTNVIPLDKALDRKTRTAQFQMNSTMASGIADYSFYPAQEDIVTVETLSLEDACNAYGVPKYIKMDIEGAERAVVEGAAEFLSTRNIEWAVETNHIVEGRFTHEAMTPILQRAGYEVKSSNEFQLWHLWATRSA